MRSRIKSLICSLKTGKLKNHSESSLFYPVAFVAALAISPSFSFPVFISVACSNGQFLFQLSLHGQ